MISGANRRGSSPALNKFLSTDYIFSPRQPRYNVNTVVLSPAWNTVQKYSRPGAQYRILGIRREATVFCQHDFDKQLNCSDSPCLFNVIDDPCEQYNVASAYPQLVSYIERVRLNEYRVGAVEITLEEDQASDPERFNGDWSIWVT